LALLRGLAAGRLMNILDLQAYVGRWLLSEIKKPFVAYLATIGAVYILFLSIGDSH